MTKKGLTFARLIITASSVLMVLLPWNGQVFNQRSKSFDEEDPGIFIDSSASTHSSIPATPPKTSNECRNFGKPKLLSSMDLFPRSLVPIFKSYPSSEKGHSSKTALIEDAMRVVNPQYVPSSSRGADGETTTPLICDALP